MLRDVVDEHCRGGDALRREVAEAQLALGHERGELVVGGAHVGRVRNLLKATKLAAFLLAGHESVRFVHCDRPGRTRPGQQRGLGQHRASRQRSVQ